MSRITAFAVPGTTTPLARARADTTAISSVLLLNPMQTIVTP